MNHLTRFLLATACGVSAFAQRGDPNNQRGDNPGATPLAAEEQLKRFHVPPGFEVQLVASEPLIGKPMNMTFDAAGRIWVTCSELYPFPARTDANGQPIAEFQFFWDKAGTRFRLGDTLPPPADVGRDRVQILGDFGPDGRARQARTFADKLNIAIGVQPLPRAPNTRGDAAIVFSIPAIWRVEDRDGDGVAESRRALFTGFGFEDTHGLSSNYTYWLDGWIYGCHGHANHSEIVDAAGNRTVFEAGGGTYRFRADGSRFERWTYGQTNPFGTAFDEDGNFYTADSHSKPVYRLLRGGYYEGLQKKHDGLGFGPAITKDSHGSTGIAGIAYYGAEQFPADYAANLFSGNPITQRINRAHLVWQGASPQAVRLADFLTCDDPCFRPVQVKLGPDGALYIADFYNPIIGHYEVRLTHPARDHSHGRIWRVVWRGPDRSAPPATLPDLSKDDATSLLAKLRVHNVTLRNLVVADLVERLGPTAASSWRGPAVARLSSNEANTPGESLGLLYALERANAAPDFATLSAWMLAGGERALGVLQLLANRGELDPQMEALAPKIVSTHPPGPPWLALSTVFSQHPKAWQGPVLLGMLAATPPNDPQLVYALRLALKNVLAVAGIAELRAWAAAKPGYADAIADVGLAVPKPFVADFLLEHLERTQFAGPRVGDFVKHAAASLSAERFDALCDSARHLSKDASLPQQLAVCEGLGLAATRLKRALPADVKEWSQAVVLRALGSADARIVERGLDASGGLAGPAIAAAWEKLALSNKPPALRASALQLLPANEHGREVAMKLLPRRPDARLLDLIVARLAPAEAGESAHRALAEVLLTAAPEQTMTLATALARSDDGASRLIALAETGKVSPRLLVRASVASALESRPAALRARVAALTATLPSESVRLDQVIAQRVGNYRPNRTDVVNGAKLFALHCAICHRYKDVGANIGPSLDGIGVRGPARLFEDILDPSRNVDPAFQRATVRLKSGAEIVGMNLQTSAGSVTVTEMDGKVQTIPAEQIASTKTEAVSIMPAAFEQAIPPDDLSDVIAYLLK